jgi:hypothetical protein
MIDYTKLQQKLNPNPGAEDVLRLRVGTVDVVNANGTLDIEMSDGVVVPDVPRLDGPPLPVGTVVQMISFRGSLLVIGSSTAGSVTPTPGQRIETSVVTAMSSTFTAMTQVAAVTAPLVAGLIYRVTLEGAFDTSVDGDTVRARIFENSTAGTQIQARDTAEMDTLGLVTALRMECEFTAVATGNKTFVATGERLGGTGNIRFAADVTFPAYMYVDYIRE